VELPCTQLIAALIIVFLIVVFAVQNAVAVSVVFFYGGLMLRLPWLLPYVSAWAFLSAHC
jgi:uncharacterized integral membrane protein